MARPKKEIIDQLEKETEMYEEDFEEDTFQEDQEEDYSSSLQIGGDIHKLSPIFHKEFPHLPKEIKYAFYDKRDLFNIRFKSRLYWDYKYFAKVVQWSSMELAAMFEIRKELYNLQDEISLKEYLKSINKQYIYDGLQVLPSNEKYLLLKQIFKQLNEAVEMQIVESLYPTSILVEDILDKYRENNPHDRNVDTLGILNEIYTITESSKGYDGKERKSMNTTISESRNIDEVKKNEEDSPDESVSGFKALAQKFGKKKTSHDSYE